MSRAQAIQQLAYLQALGIPLYVSRAPLPGAAPSRRVALPRRPQAAAPASDEPAVRETADAVSLKAQLAVAPAGRSRPAATPEPAAPLPAAPLPAAPASPSTMATAHDGPVPRFTLAAVVAGPFLWLEELPDGVASRDQLALIQAMAVALGAGNPHPAMTQFAWPPHSNRQLDLGEDAARVALGSFLSRRAQEHDCEVLVLLGEGSSRRLGSQSLALPRVSTLSTREMLADPARKREVWSHLRSLRRDQQ